MKILIFGATGMVGQGVLRECLEARDVERVVAVGRTSTGITHERLSEILLPDLFAFSALREQLAPFDACFFCLGVSSVGMKEDAYTRITYDLTLSIARLLRELNPQMTFTYVSGASTDSSEQGKLMWARVKGRTENALLALPFRAAYMFRPGFVQPIGGVRSKTAWVQAAYSLTAPLAPLLKRVAPGSIATSQEMGRAMLAVAKHGFEKRVLENRDITRAAANAS